MTEQLIPTDSTIQIDHHHGIMLVGSCFSEHIGQRLKRFGFNVLSNPYGTIFHPIPLAACLDRQWTPSERFLQQDDVWLSFDTSSEIYALSETAFSSKLKERDMLVKSYLQQTKTLIITFGSAHGYRLKKDGMLVANCHKQSQDLFTKELSELTELEETWAATLYQLKAVYPDLHIVLTVSPVRYSRDGWVENNRSKARLIQLAEVLEKHFENVHYFPAYELIIDLLRDYRYFAADGVHPNDQAIDAVWRLFSDAFFSVTTKCIVSEAEQLRRMEEHRLLFPNSRQADKFRQQLNEKRESFLSLHPYIQWS